MKLARDFGTAITRCVDGGWMWEIALVITFTALMAVLLLFPPPRYDKAPPPAPTPAPDIAATAGPPWVYGRTDARYLRIKYADLECPYCQAHFVTLRPWMDAHADLVALEWRHLPLSMHECDRRSQVANVR